MTAIYR